MSFDHRRRPDSSVQKLMLRYKVLPYEDDDDDDIPTVTFRTGIQSYTRSYNRSYSPPDFTMPAPQRITSATYRYNAPYQASSVAGIKRDGIKRDGDASDLENSVNQFLAEMDLRRKARSLENGSKRIIASNSGKANHHYYSVKGLSLSRAPADTYNSSKSQQKWSGVGHMFAKDVHDVLSKTRQQLMQTSPKYRSTTAGHHYTEPRNTDRFSYKTWTAPSTKATSSKNYSSNYEYKSKRHSTPVKDKSIQSDTPTYENSNSNDVSKIVNGDEANHEVENKKSDDDINVPDERKPELSRSESRPDGLVLWEDIDLDDIIEDTEDDDLWQKGQVETVAEPGKFVGHGFRTEPVRMTNEKGCVTWAKPRGELDIIITHADEGKDFVCKIQTQRQGVRVSQLMSEGEEEVLFSGKNDLESGQFRSFQGHVVLMLEALCTPFLKKVFEMNYEILQEDAA